MPTQSSTRKTVFIGLAIFLGFILVVIASLVWLLPTIIQSQLPPLLSETTGKPTTVEKVEIDYMPLTIRVNGFAIKTQTGQPIIAFDGLFLEANTSASIKQRALVISKLVLDKPLVHLEKTPKGSLNVTELAGKSKETDKKDSEPFPVLVNRFELHDGKLTYSDAKQPHMNTTLYPLNFELNEFSTHIGEPATANLAFSLDTGAKIAWDGTLGISPVHSKGKLKLDQVDLKKNLAFADVNFLLGIAHAEMDYQADYDKESLKLVVNHTKLGVSDLIYKQQDQTLKIKNFDQEAKLTLTHQNGKLDLTLTNAKSHAQDLHYQQPDLSVNLAALDNETELALKQENGKLNLTFGNTKLHLKDIRYRQPDVAVNLAKLEHETELTLNQEQGQLQLTATKAKTNGQGLDLELPLVANAKSFTIDSPYQVSNLNKTSNFSITKGKFNAAGLRASERDSKKPLIDVAKLDVEPISFDLSKRQLNIGSITIGNATTKAELNPDGSINFDKLLPKQNKAQNTTANVPVTAAKPWQISAEKINLSDSEIGFSDRSLKTPVNIKIKPVNLTITGYNSQKTTPFPVQLDFITHGGGNAKINGKIGLSPVTADLDVTINKIALEKMNGYFSKFIQLNLIDGRANIDGHVKLAGQEPLAVSFKGNLSVTEFLTRDQRIFKDFLKWKRLSLEGISVDTLGNRYTIKNLHLDEPYTRVTIRKDKSSNFDNLVISQATPTKTPKPALPPKKTAPVYFRLDKVKVTGGSSNFSDFSLILPFSAFIQNIQGGANGVSSEKNSTIKMTLTGNAFELAPVDIHGSFSPYLGDYDVEMNFEGLPMPLVSPYMVQFAGYKVERGKMSLGLQYKVANKKLTANNKILIDQFELGEKVENPQAASVPLELAVALLKDSSGRIKFDVPISGSLEDPEFSIGEVIFDALTNAMTRIISSPFSLISSLIESDDDLSTISFSPGNAELSQPEQMKLNDIAGALTERPALTIGIKGMAYLQQDWPPLSGDALLDQLKERRADEINQDADVKIRAEYVSLSDEEYKRLLADMFIEKFPAMAEKSFFGTPKLKNDQEGDFYEVAKKTLMAAIHPSHQRLKTLSIARAREISKHLIKHGKIPQQQIYILDPVLDEDNAKKDIVCTLTLRAN